MNYDKIKLISRLKEINAIKKGDFVLSSGTKSGFYVDIKEAYGDSLARSMIIEGILENFPEDLDFVAGSGFGGIPLASWIANEKKLNLSLVRSEIKKYGTEKQIEGYIPKPSERGIILDDVFTTGGSLEKTAKHFQKLDSEILEARFVLKRGDGRLEFPLRYLICVEDL